MNNAGLGLFGNVYQASTVFGGTSCCGESRRVSAVFPTRFPNPDYERSSVTAPALAMAR